MTCRLCRRSLGLAPLFGLALFSSAALAQEPSGAFPEEPAPAPAPAPAAAPEPEPPPVAAPAPAPTPAPAAQPYAQDPSAQPGYGSEYAGAPPPPPAREQDEPTKIPPFSIRVDPFNWLLEGRLGFELEVGVLAKWLTIETIPVFVVNESPPLFNLSGHEDNLYQDSGGLGPLAGATLGVNFWLSGRAFDGYVIRTGITNYAIEYETRAADGSRIDFVKHTERQFYGMLGSISRWGAFTLGGGIGLGYELNQQERCFPDGATGVGEAISEGCDGELHIALDPNVNQIANLNGFLFPMDLLVRFSLGVTID